MSDWNFKATGNKIKGGAECRHPSDNFRAGQPNKLKLLVNRRDKSGGAKKSAPKKVVGGASSDEEEVMESDEDTTVSPLLSLSDVDSSRLTVHDR